MFKTKIKRKKVKEKLSIETIDDVKQKIIAHVKRDLKAANALLDELRQSYAETPYLLAELLSDIAQEIRNTKIKLALLEEAFKLSPVHPMVLNRYAYALAKFKPKQVEKAFELFERALTTRIVYKNGFKNITTRIVYKNGFKNITTGIVYKNGFKTTTTGIV